MPCDYRIRWRAALLPLLFITHVHLLSADTLQYLYTAFTPGIHFPKFTAAVLVDGEQVVSYDSNISKMIPKTEWMKKIEADDPGYWHTETRRMIEQQDWLQDFVYRAKQRLNHTEGDHILQRVYGCGLDDVITGGYDRYGYDGEDFISLDLRTGTWTAANDKVKSFINHWDPDGDKAEYWKDFVKTDCIDQLKKLVSYGKETLERKVRPEVSVFQKHSPSPEVVCHATGYFPTPLNITWQKDGEDVHEDVELRETLPNQDGSFQRRSILKVPAEELQKYTYTCVVQHSSLEKELVREVPKGGGSAGGSVGESRRGPDAGSDEGPIGILVAVFVVLGTIAVIVCRKKKNSGFTPVPPKPL